MSKRRQTSFEQIATKVGTFLSEFQSETDRGTALVAGAYLDDLLASMLRRYFIDHAKVVDALLGSQGPLETFASRTQLALAIGILREDQYDDLVTIRKIRNEFGHSHGRAAFDSPPVCDLIANLNQLALMENLREEMSPNERELLLDRFKTVRQRFVGNVVHLSVGLTLFGTQLRHRRVGEAIASIQEARLPLHE